MDWLFCDLLEGPRLTLGLLNHWMEEGWRRGLVANLYHDREEITLVGRV